MRDIFGRGYRAGPSDRALRLAGPGGRPVLGDPEARPPKLDKVFALIEEWTSQHTKWGIMEKLNALSIPCGPILSTKELIEDATLAELSSVVSVPHPVRGSFKTVGCPVRPSDSPVSVERPPLLGEHTDEILATLGLRARGNLLAQDGGRNLMR